MSAKSTIEWTDATWNPATGCTKISPGCRSCYAETFAERFRGVEGHPFEQGFDLRLWPDRLSLPLSWRKPRRVFVNSMSDLFHEGIPFEFVDRVMKVMTECGQHTFQVLTKRPERMLEYLRDHRPDPTEALPKNVWLGVSVEREDYLWRVDMLLQTDAVVRFLSCEPLLGPLDLQAHLSGPRSIGWVIVGGESGRRARPMQTEWARQIRDDCVSAGVPFFFKQWGGWNKKKAGRTLDGRTWDECPTGS